jgi:hypothetical protein
MLAPAALEATLQTSHISEVGSNRASDLICRKGIPEHHMELACSGTCLSLDSCTSGTPVVTIEVVAPTLYLAPCLIRFACALFEELRDSDLIVSFDHRSPWKAPNPQPTEQRANQTEGSVRCN